MNDQWLKLKDSLFRASEIAAVWRSGSLTYVSIGFAPSQHLEHIIDEDGRVFDCILQFVRKHSIARSREIIDLS